MKNLLLLLLTVVACCCFQACKKSVQKTRAQSHIDKTSLSFGNQTNSRTLIISNRGEQPLSYSLTENTDWLDISNPGGTIGGRQQQSVELTVDRTGLAQNEYSTLIEITTSDRDYQVPVYMAVDMFLVTVVNPSSTTIHIAVDTGYALRGNNYTRQIGSSDSTQFAYFTAPDLFAFYACTFGIYTDSTQLGMKIEWDDVYVIKENVTPRVVLDVSPEYFFLNIINPFKTLNPLYVNTGTPYESIENIFIYQSTRPLPVGYYRALPNTVIRAIAYDGASSVTWTNGDQFSLPFTPNQSITIENYLSDTTKSSRPVIGKTMQPQVSTEIPSCREIHFTGTVR